MASITRAPRVYLRLIVSLAFFTPMLPAQAAGWSFYGGDEGGSHYSPLQDINRDTVGRLEVAWEYHTGDASTLRDDVPPTTFQATPVLWNNTLFFCSSLGRAFAVDADSGQQRWVFDSRPRFHPDDGTTKCRGVALWHDDTVGRRGQGECNSRVLMGTPDGRLFALDALSGRACKEFGESGAVDLTRGLGELRGNEAYMSSPPLVAGDLVIQGAAVRDNARVDSPGGVIRAWDVRTGALRWAFDPVPAGAPTPQALGAPPEQLYHRGTPNAWGILSSDTELGLVFVPFGSPGLDFIGAHRTRHGFDDGYYANSVVALELASGKPRWSFQMVHHDLWDYDVAAQPVLIDLPIDGAMLPVLIQVTKMGHVFILNRATGTPAYPVEERPVPRSDVPGEFASPTQPFPTFPLPLHPEALTPDDAWGLTFYDQQACRDKIAAAANEGIFTPPSLNRYSIQYPGVAGGQNWGGLAFDPINRLLVMPQNYVVTYNQLKLRDAIPPERLDSELDSYSPNLGAPFVIRHEVLLSPWGMPCIAPPWGTLLAVSLDSGLVQWEVPLGSVRDMVPALSWFPYFPDTGLPSAGGPIATAGGLAFIGASLDDYIRAFDIRDGKEVWRHRLPAGGQATPMTYRSERSGQQYVVIAAGGHAYMRTRIGDSLIAFRLAD
ncbi:MAG: pyrroloquinoline quinone-dependent dehydrogenase [Pseudomonadota bacterium]